MIVNDRGFSLVEVLVAAAIMTASFLVLFHLASSGQRVGRAQPQAADLNQRLRVAVDMMQRDLLMAGSGLAQGSAAGPLIDYLPPIVPARTGAKKADPELSSFSDRISILYASDAAPGPPLVSDMPGPAADVFIDASATGCPSSGLCGFSEGTRSLILDTSGAGKGYDMFTVQGVLAGLAHGAPDPVFSRSYAAASARVLPVTQHVYYLDAAARRLMLYDGYQSDLPLVDNIVSLNFAYFVDPAPTSAPRPADGTGNCVYAPGSPPVPLLADLEGTGPSPAGPTLFTDGPICGLTPGRFDGDLLRVRRVRVTIRAQVADRGLRGAGPAFASAGASTDGYSYVPDIAVTFDVAPRNLRSAR